MPAPGGLRLAGHDAAGRRFEAEVGWQRLDLAAGLERLPFDAVQLVTASALTDLVSAAWLQALAECAAAQRCALLLALAVDGRVAWTPTDPDDAAVHAAFAAHQRRDKGFGPALGPQAPVEAATRLAALGYRVVTAPSDWQIDGACDPVMVAAMIDGHAAAATEQQPAAAGCIAAWRARRHAAVGTTLLRVGHVDLFATPPAAP